MACLDANIIAQYFDLELKPAETERLFAHIDTCPTCARLFIDTVVAQKEAAPTTQIDPAGDTAPERPRAIERASLALGAKLGRYQIDRILGMGGMGVVYAGRDPDLDRKVAIKLLRPDSRMSAATLRARLGREAQAMARLSHPNVINVYEIGAHGEQVFVVMELIDGTTLGEWLKEKRRSWREIVQAFIAAGAGLEAAHRAGVVHRDFKPDNVLMSRDGRVSVTDFGLARIEKGDAEAASLPPADAVALDVTYSGLLVGTPAYMAPEQMRGEPTDARADLFSFCVALYEALYGTRPYLGAKIEELRATTEGGKLEAPRRVDGPGEYRRAIERGLRPRAAERQASMGELLAVLRVDPIARRRRRVAVACAALAAIAVAAGFVQLRRRTQMCLGAEARLAGVWDPARKKQIHAALVKTGVPYAEPVWHTIEKTLNGFAESWSSMRTEACEATRLRGTQSEELLDLRMTCLDERLYALKAQTDIFAAADVKTAETAASAARSLPTLSDCADPAALRAPVRQPADRAERERIATIAQRIAEARANNASGHYPNGLSIAGDAVRAAQATGYRPVEAEALLVSGQLRFNTGDFSGAAKVLIDSVLAAEAGGANEVAALAWLLLAMTDNALSHYDDAHLALRHVSSALERRSQPSLEAQLANIESATESLEGHAVEAEQSQRRSLAIRERIFGPNHIEVAESLMDLGSDLGDLGRYEEAVALGRRSVAIYEQALGPMHPEVAIALTNLGRSLAKDHAEEALATFNRALEIKTAVVGELSVAATMENIGVVLSGMGRPEEALALNRKILRIREKEYGPDHPDVALTLQNMGEELINLRRFDEATACARRSLAIFRARFGADHLFTSGPQLLLGRILVKQHRAAEALPLLEKALSLRQANPDEPDLVAEAKFHLACALWALHRDPERALKLAREARTTFGLHPTGDKLQLDEIDAELARHR